MSQVVDVIRRFVVKVHCKDCDEVLNTSRVYETLDEMQKSWMMMVFSSGLVTGKCPKGCRATFSDCNINTTLKVYDADSGEHFDLKDRRLSDLPTTRTEVV